MQVVCLQEDAYMQLVDTIVEYVKLNHLQEEYKWVTAERAKELLDVEDSTLQKYRDEGEIIFTQRPGSKKILYDRHSITAFHERYAQYKERYGKK